MKIMVSSLNSKFIHSALACRYLISYCHDEFPEIELREFTINQDMDYFLSEIYRDKPSILGLSCYIWNINEILMLCKTLKQLLPSLTIILGGPEVSFEPVEIMSRNPAVDYIISGQGEESFLLLLRALKNGTDVERVPSLTYRSVNGEIMQGDGISCLDFKDTNFAYRFSKTMVNLENRIVYYECSRGCPYHCAYCMSGLSGPVQMLSIQRVKEEILHLISSDIKQVKFVDRTFNWKKDYSLEVFKFLAELDTSTSFHFEIRGDLLDDETLDFLQTVDPGRFQFEIGIQSTNTKTLKRINRYQNFATIAHNISRINSGKNIHLHLDLIAGLPYEDLTSFSKSFNDVYNLGPDMLQLGFLKLLKGSNLRDSASQFGYEYRHFPPYEVLKTRWMTYEDMLVLKDIEVVFNTYYNSDLYRYSLQVLVEFSGLSPFDLYKELAVYFRSNHYFENRHTLVRKFEILYEFFTSSFNINEEIIREVIKFDMLLHMKHRQLPDWCAHYEPEGYKQKVHDLLKEECVLKNIHHLKDYRVAELLKQIHIEVFHIDIQELIHSKRLNYSKTWVLFDHSDQGRDKLLNKATFFTIND